MSFVKCKNDTEKLQAIKNYCNAKIKEYNHRIEWFRVEQSCPLDYAEEIHDLETRNAHFRKIVEIIEADEFTSVMVWQSV